MRTIATPQGMRAEELATITGASLRTARRWKAAGQMPAGLALGVALLQDGDLGALSTTWRGWILRRDQLITPEGWAFRPGEIAAVPMLYQLRAELEKQLRTPQQFALLPG